MAYCVKTGVVLFDMCGESYLFPTRSSEVKLGFLITVSPAMADLLRGKNGPEHLKAEERKKLDRLVKAGFVEGSDP